MRERKRKMPDISITRDTNESSAILEGLNNIKADELVKATDVVVITPNLVQQKPPDTGVVTGQESLRSLIRYVKGLNPRRIIVATGSGEKDTNEIATALGFDELIKSEGIEFADLNAGPFTEIGLNHDKPAKTKLNKLYEEMTVLISFTQLKIHQEATISACIKNITMGWPPSAEHGNPKKATGIHLDLHGFIHAMAAELCPDISILSCNPAMIGTGPAGGIPVHTGLVVTGTDPVAVDTIGARFLGFQPQAVNYLYKCIGSGLGIGDVKLMNFSGLSLPEAEMIFSTAAYGLAVVIDQ